MSDDVAQPAEDNPNARFTLEGSGGSLLQVNVCALHPGGVEMLLSDGRSTAVVELEVSDDADDAAAVIQALVTARLVAKERAGG